ncbi:hypothetical protein [uncultured Anaerococcus sp.]|uniref:hypothetical protein n=1 Tax=uncultured Anaerococcus sp. TaxID=293428 RepID=UPI0025D4997E|nr:hypothetical protein [uncultured Anaerococcus sp.]
MRTKEFIRRVKSLGFKVGIAYKCNDEIRAIIISDYEESEFVRIWSHRYAMSTIADGFNSCMNSNELYKLCFEYASTPPEDREEEKKFYLEHTWMNSPGFRYLTMNIYNGDYYLNSDKKCEWEKKQFTLKEREEIKEKLDTDLADFELVEVIDD